jgi:hypothetical protein
MKTGLREMKGREDFLMELKELKPLVGSQVIIWGYRTLQGFLIRWLQFLWLGVKRAPTHVQKVYNGIWDISAEAKGVVLVDRLEVLRRAKRVKIVVHKLYKQPDAEKNFQKISNKYLKKPYDFYFYFNMALRVFMVFIPLVLVWTFIINSYFISVLIIFIILIYWPFRRFLLNKSKNSWACAEISNCLDKEMGVETGIDIDHNSSPLYYHRLSIACSDFELLYDSGWIGKR